MTPFLVAQTASGHQSFYQPKERNAAYQYDTAMKRRNGFKVLDDVFHDPNILILSY
jgi:hypothetical protein